MIRVKLFGISVRNTLADVTFLAVFFAEEGLVEVLGAVLVEGFFTAGLTGALDFVGASPFT